MEKANRMIQAAFRVAQVSALGAIVGAVISGPWASVTGAALGLAAGALQEAERHHHA